MRGAQNIFLWGAAKEVGRVGQRGLLGPAWEATWDATRSLQRRHHALMLLISTYKLNNYITKGCSSVILQNFYLILIKELEK